MLTKYKYTIRGVFVGLGMVGLILLVIVTWLVIRDLFNYEGKCAGSILPFLGEQQELDCTLTEYLKRNALFSFLVLFYSRWYLALIVLLIAVVLGWLRDFSRLRE